MLCIVYIAIHRLRVIKLNVYIMVALFSILSIDNLDVDNWCGVHNV